MVSHNPATFDSHSHCGSGNIMALVCHVIQQYHMTKGLSNIMGTSPSTLVAIQPSLVSIGTVVVKI